MYSTNNHGLMKKVDIVCAHFYKFISMGQVPKSQQIWIQSPIKFPFSNVDLVWIPKVKHGGTNKVSIEIAYVTHARVCEVLEGEWGDAKTLVEWNMHTNLPPQKDIKTPSIKNHLGHTWLMWCSMHSFSFFQMSFTNTYDPYHKNVL